MRAWATRSVAGVVALCAASATGATQEFDQLLLAQAQVRTTTPRAPTAAASGELNLVAKVNNWTVGLAAGLPEGTFLRFAAEIARNLNGTDDLRVLATVTPGATENVKDLLYLKGMDIAITHADVFEHFRNVEKIPNIDKRVNYVSEMYISELHVLVRPEINSFKDLEGKKVSFHTPGAGPSVTGPILFQRLGVKVEPVYVNNAIAYEMMKKGELAALIHTVGKPNDLFVKNKNDAGFKFLPVPLDKFDDLYVPSVFTAEDYPGYVKPGEKVETIGVQAVLAVYNWPQGERSLPTRAALHRVLLRPLPELPPAALSSEVEEHQPGRQGAGVDALLGGRGEAQADGRSPARAARHRSAARTSAGGARGAQRFGRAGATVPEVPRVEQVAGQAVTTVRTS